MKAVLLSILGLLATVLGLSAGELTLSWQDNSDNETGFTIERAIGSGEFATLANVGSDAAQRAAVGTRVSYVDATVAPGTTYSYRVRAYNDAGPSGWTNTATATTPQPPPPLPEAPSEPAAEPEQAPPPYLPPEPVVTLQAGGSLRVVASP